MLNGTRAKSFLTGTIVFLFRSVDAEVFCERIYAKSFRQIMVLSCRGNPFEETAVASPNIGGYRYG